MRVSALAGVCVLSSIIGASPAHATLGSGELGTESSDADLLHVSCYDDGSGAPGSMVAQVGSTLPIESSFVSVQIVRGSAATNSTDPVGGDGFFGPLVHVDGGAGEYDVFVDKSGAGAVVYELSVQCVTGTGGTGVPTGTFVEGWAPAVPFMDSFVRTTWIAALVGLGMWALRGTAARRGRA